MNRLLPIACLLAAALIVIGARVLGQSDLYEKDQPKTIAYTADVVLNDRYALPRDMLYQPATKPPLYNWIGAIVVRATGSWDEWALKLPSLLASVATGAIVFAMGAWTWREHVRRWWLASIAGAVWFTFGFDVTHGSVIRLSYLARPDMLQCALLTGAWACAMVGLVGSPRPKRWLWATGFWVCVAGAALTKGPVAGLAVVYLVALLVAVRRERKPGLLFAWIGGVLLPAACVGAWLAFAWQQDAQHVRAVILGAEVADRVTAQAPEGTSKPVYYSAMWFVTKTVPWGAAALVGAALLLFARASAKQAEGGPAQDSASTDARPFALILAPGANGKMIAWALWLLILLIGFSIPAGKRMDYLLPTYPPACLLVAYLIERLRVVRVAMVLPIGVALLLARAQWTRFHEAQTHFSDRTVAFAREVAGIAQDRSVMVLVRGKHPLITLLGRHQGSYLTPVDIARSEFVVVPRRADATALAVSEPVPTDFETAEPRSVEPLGLYRTADLPLEQLVEQQKRLGEWDRAANPYRAPDTVFRVE